MGSQAVLGSSRSATSGERGMGSQTVLGSSRSVTSSSVVNTPAYGPTHVPAAIRSPAATQGVVTQWWPTYGPTHVPAPIRSPAATQGVVPRGG